MLFRSLTGETFARYVGLAKTPLSNATTPTKTGLDLQNQNSGATPILPSAKPNKRGYPMFKSALKLVAVASLVASTSVSTSAHAWFNTSNVNQFGTGHSIGGAQTGSYNHMEIFQTGWGNTSIATQDGWDNETVIGQSGIANTATSTQTGECNISGIAQFGVGNSVTADQSGDCNAQAVIQMGTGNSANTTQVGTGNVAVIIQY